MPDNRLTAANIDELMARGEAAIREYISTQDWQLCDLETLLELIPPCPAHGSHCIPHAREWVQAQLDAAPPRPPANAQETDDV